MVRPHSRGTTFASSGPASVRQSNRPPSGRAGLLTRYAGIAARQVSLSALKGMVRLSSKSAHPKVIAQGAGCCLGLVLRSSRSQTSPTDNLIVCHESGPLIHHSHRNPLSACHGSKLQTGIVGSGRPPLRCTGAEHCQGSSHRRGTETSRVSHAVSTVVNLLVLRLIGTSRGFTASLYGLASYTILQGTCVTDRRQSPLSFWCQPVLMVLP